MMTQSHFLLTALFGHRLRLRRPVHLGGLLLGSVLPDVPLILLTIGYYFYRQHSFPFREGEHFYGALYDQFYFHHPLWVVSTSFFHAPLILVALAVLGHRLMRQESRWGVRFYWFALGCGLHSLIDTFTHHNDGPLLLFPFDWSYRFPAPVSYWHPAYHGRIFSRVENSLDLAIVIYFAGQALLWILRRRRTGSG